MWTSIYKGNKNKKLSLIIINFRNSNRMKKHLQQTPSTAHKGTFPSKTDFFNFESSSKLQYSANLFTPYNGRKSSKLNSKISSLRTTIDDLIQTVSSKRSIQRGAVQRVCDVNAELAEHLSQGQIHSGELPVHSVRRDKDFGQVSTYIDHQKSRRSLYESSHIDQSLSLKQSLNNQMRETNQLMHRLKQLQQEHEYLREQSGRQDRASQYEIEENRRLKEELSQLKGCTAGDLWMEFLQLKKENQMLRQDTILLLKRDQGQKYNYGKDNFVPTYATGY